MCLEAEEVDRNASKSLNSVATNILSMPKPGYTCVTLRKDVARLLRSKAQQSNLGLNELLLKLLEDSPAGTVPRENKPKSGSFSEMVPRAGLEPATIRSSAGRSPRLSYRG